MGHHRRRAAARRNRLLRRLRRRGVDEAAGLPAPQRRIMAARAQAAPRACPARRCGRGRARPAGPSARWSRAGARSRSRSCPPSAPRLAWIAASTSLVERRGRLVEHQDRRILEDHARDRDALALAARELDAALADLRVIAVPAAPVLEPEDEVVRLRELAPPPRSAPRSRPGGRSGCCRGSSGAGARCPASPPRSARAGSPASPRRCPARRSGCGRPRRRRNAAAG